MSQTEREQIDSLYGPLWVPIIVLFLGSCWALSSIKKGYSEEYYEAFVKLNEIMFILITFTLLAYAIYYSWILSNQEGEETEEEKGEITAFVVISFITTLLFASMLGTYFKFNYYYM